MVELVDRMLLADPPGRPTIAETHAALMGVRSPTAYRRLAVLCAYHRLFALEPEHLGWMAASPRRHAVAKSLGQDRWTVAGKAAEPSDQ